MSTTHIDNSKAGLNRFVGVSIFTPYIWTLLIVAAYPFLLLADQAFEALERTGPLGAFLATPLMSAALVGYVALIFVLKNRAA
jgi:hypothetical protein